MLNLNSLNPQQRLAVETISGPVLILAGAGTGKTRVITCRIAHMIRKGISPGNILAVTFTNKAAREMRERVAGLIPRSHRDSAERNTDRLTISTFHSLGAQILRQHIDRLGYKKNFVIYDEQEQLGAIKKILSHISAKGGDKIDPSRVLSFLGRLKSGAVKAGAFADDASAALAQRIRSRYESALRACNALDFDDLLVLTLRLLREFPEVLEACRRRYRYVMVDEYQDTNGAQFELVHMLTREKDHRNLCVVGDDDQSIYGWRGAEIANILEMEQHFPEVKIIKLEQNYRSTGTILGAANAIIKKNHGRRPKQLWSQKNQGAKVLLHVHENDEGEARSVVDDIECDRLVRRIPWGKQAILFRTNIQARPFEMALRQSGVRYRLIGGQSFFDRREVRDFLAYLKTFLNPHDDVSLLRIANVPARGLSDATMERLLAASQERHCSVFSAMRHTDVQQTFPAKTRENLMAFIAFIERTRALLECNASTVQLSQWAERFLVETGYLEELRRSEKNQDTAENRVRNIKELVASLDGDGSPSGASLDRLQAFLEELALDTEREGEEENRGDTVTLITIHSCKGLEWPHVHIVGVEEGLLPHSRSKQENTLDEERRLFYVAITRAQESLHISHCLGRTKYGQLLPCHPSQFLNDLPEEFVERADEQKSKPVDVSAGKSMFAAMREALG
ncbi:MAG: UvrD-helicase domain-containing protein [Verrucomicrobia subdivision 3 bacterium]|nr:UvrD-helicase domain-containing protein [Limisphaerales bacterium]